jgi:hypothetical protein
MVSGAALLLAAPACLQHVGAGLLLLAAAALAGLSLEVQPSSTSAGRGMAAP